MSHDVTFSSTDDVISSSTSRPPETSQFEITSLSSESSQSTTISQSWETSQSTPPTTSATAAPPPGSATSSVSETPVSETPVSETPMSVTRSVPVTPSVSVTPATSNAFAGPKCTCVNNKAPTVSQHALAVKETQEAAARLQKELVLTSQTRAERRRYRSIPDDRWSVQALGWAGVAVLLVAALCVVLPDVITLCRYVTTLRSRAPPRHNGHGRRDKTGGDNDVTQKTTVPLKTVKKMAI
ncbi:hypothetical protein BaRGS_00031535 [Batillaria attramentaria]|uniref:Uncharacterized protein n=1 Tax=Batillaria attramentaria TaxID=370345 RepID=A0ABD0JRA1_9CAEN